VVEVLNPIETDPPPDGDEPPPSGADQPEEGEASTSGDDVEIAVNIGIQDR
jgi:hypothetical protein